MVTKERLNYIDIAKGIGILLVVLGHTITNESPIKTWLYSFHMPLFFIISGILCKHTHEEDKKFTEIFVSKCKRLIIPYVSFELIYIFLWMIFHDFSLAALRWNIIDSLLLYCKVGANWFLATLFVVELSFIMLVKCVKNKNIRYIISMIIYVIPFFISTDQHRYIILLRCFTAFGFFSLGYHTFDLLKESNSSFKKITLYGAISLSSIAFKCVELWNLTFNNPIVYTFYAIIGTLLIVNISKKIMSSRILEFFGKNSLVVMDTHQILLSLELWIFGIYESTIFVYSLLTCIAILFLEVPIIHLINTHTPWMLGKFSK